MTSNELAFVFFEPLDGKFIGLLSIESLLSSERDPELVLRKAAKLYECCVVRMGSIVAEIQALRAARRLVPARKMWRLGNAIFELRDGLERLSLQVDGLYDHLVRDIGVKRKWLEKVVIFRRYLLKEDLIPNSLNWGRCEKGTRRVAERLRDRLPLSNVV